MLKSLFRASRFVTLCFYFCLSSPLSATDSEFVVKAGGEGLPSSLRNLPGAMAKIFLRSSNPMQDRWDPGYPRVATAWHLGGGIWMSLGSGIARNSVVGPSPLPKTTSGKFYAGFGVGPASAPLRYVQKMVDVYLLGTVMRTIAIPEPEDFRWEVVDREAKIWMAEYDPNRFAKDYAIFQVRGLEASAKIPLSDGEEELVAGDEVIVLGYPGNNQFDLPLRTANLYAVRANIKQMVRSTSIVLDRSLDSGFEGAVVLHPDSGRAIAMVTFAKGITDVHQLGASLRPRTQSIAVRIPALRLNEKLQEIFNTDCESQIAADSE